MARRSRFAVRIPRLVLTWDAEVLKASMMMQVTGDFSCQKHGFGSSAQVLEDTLSQVVHEEDITEFVIKARAR